MKIAIVKLSALGDIVHAMVVLQFIKKEIPNCQIDWIVEECFAAVLEHNPNIHTILPVNLKAIKKDKFKLFSELKKLKKYANNNYDLVIDMQGLLKSAIVSKILGVNSGFDKNSIREKIASTLYKKSFFVPYDRNVIVRNTNLIESSLNFRITKEQIKEKESFLFFTKEDEEKTKRFLSHKKRNIIYILGSSWESKIYPKEKFVEIVKQFNENHLLVWGNNKEEEYANYIEMQTGAVKLPKLNLNELKALISKADFVIGGDSGPTHMAWALNRPSITIFGPTPSCRNTFITNVNNVIDCGNEIDAMNLDKKDYCIREISSKAITNIVKKLLYG